MGFYAGVGPTCYETLAEAAAATCATLQGITELGVYQCAQVVSTGTSSGTLRHIWRHSNGTSITQDHLHNWRTCTPNDPFGLTAADGALVSAAILSVWAIAWGWRALYTTLRSSGEVEE